MRTFPDRFSKEYLEFLLTQLNLDNLIETADYEPFEKEARRKNKKCITINFCGNAANTLLGNEIGRGKNLDQVSELRTKIKDAFWLLFDDSTMERLDSLNIYLRIRFCFSYLYADFAASLISAEKPENWEYTGEGLKYDFHYTAPIDEKQLKTSSIYVSQQNSLNKIYSLIQKKPELINRGGTKQTHFIQVRFSVLASPICILKINNIICCDTYLYAMFPEENEGLSLHYPISILERHSKIDTLQFESASKHFNYLWRHDLTLFCGDGTEFDMNNFAGLKTVRRPNDIDWHDKETRVRNSQMRNKAVHLKDNEKYIKEWKADLTMKLKLATSNVIISKKNKLFVKIKNANAWILTVVILFMLIFLLTLFVSRPVYDEITTWLLEHTLFSMLIAGISIISFISERIASIHSKDN